MSALREAAAVTLLVVIVADTSHDQVMLAGLGVIASAMAVLVFVIRTLLGRSEQRVTAQVAETKAGVSRIEDVVNHVDQDVKTPNGKPTLGRMVRDLVDRVDEGFSANDEAHATITETVKQVGKRVDDNTRRIDRIEDEPKPPAPKRRSRKPPAAPGPV